MLPLPPKLFRDDIWGNLRFTKAQAQIIDTPQFQRLRWIHQLGMAQHVYPTANHTRFEHSLGTCHLAGKLMTQLVSQQYSEPLEISQQEYRNVSLAALVHDLGHGPFSHWFDHFIHKMRPDKPEWCHEDQSVLMLDYLLSENGIDMDTKDVNMVGDLIHGHSSGYPEEKRFLFDIVSNQRNSIDVDKWDYIPRDATSCKIPVYDITRLMDHARVHKGQIAFPIKCFDDVVEFFATRFSLHKRLYGHPVTRGIEYMYLDALALADDQLQISSSIDDPSAYTVMDDSVVRDVRRLALLQPEDVKLQQATDILKKVDKRQIYKCVDRFNVVPELREVVTRDKVNSDTISRYLESTSGLTESDIIVEFLKQSYSPLGGSPIDNVLFLRKWDDQTVKVPAEAQTSVMPQEFDEVTVRCFLRGGNDHQCAALQKAFRALMNQLDSDPEIQGRLGGPLQEDYRLDVKLSQKRHLTPMSTPGSSPSKRPRDLVHPGWGFPDDPSVVSMSPRKNPRVQ